MNNIKLRNFDISNSSKLTLMGGMNVLESRDLALKVAEEFKTTCDRYNINYTYFAVSSRKLFSSCFKNL